VRAIGSAEGLLEMIDPRRGIADIGANPTRTMAKARNGIRVHARARSRGAEPCFVPAADKATLCPS